MRFAERWISCTVHAIRDVAPAIREFVLRPAGPSVENYAPGSHINVGVFVDGRPETRCYSLVGDFGPEGYRIAVRRAPDSRGGSLYMWSLQPGARVEISTPTSLFEIDWTRRSYCLIAGGIGITPILGIAGMLNRRNAAMELHYAVTSRRDAAFLDDRKRSSLGHMADGGMRKPSASRRLDQRCQVRLHKSRLLVSNSGERQEQPLTSGHPVERKVLARE